MRRCRNLFADLAEAKEKPVNCIVSALKSNGEAAALEVSFTCKGRLAMHLIAFNLEFEKSGAGVLLLEKSLKDGYAEGLEVYDMLAPGDPYKLDWCDQSDTVYDWVKPLSLSGLSLCSGLSRLPARSREIGAQSHAPAVAPADARRLCCEPRRRTEIGSSLDAEFLLQTRRRRRVLEEQLLVRVDDLVRGLRHQRRLVKARQYELQLARIRIDVADGEDALLTRLEAFGIDGDKVLVKT